MREYNQAVIIPNSPVNVAFNLCLNILESRYSHSRVFFEELKEACKKSEHVRPYVGNRYKLRDNVIMYKVLERLLNNTHVIQIKQKPVVLRWVTRDTVTLVNNAMHYSIMHI